MPTEKRIGPAGNGTESENQAGEPDTQIVQHVPRKLIGARVERQLDEALWSLRSGTLELWQLTPALQAWWTIAYGDGAASRQPEIDRLTDEADRLYLRAYNSAARIAEIQRQRVDAGLAEYEVAFFAAGAK